MPARLKNRVLFCLNEWKYLLVYLLIGALTIPCGIIQPVPGLDPSWRAGIRVAFANSLQFGRDIVFTNGLLGFLNNSIIVDYTTWRLGFIFMIFSGFFILVASWLVFKKLTMRWYIYVLFIIIYYLFSTKTPIWNVLLACSFLLFLLLIERESKGKTLFVLASCGVLLAAISLAKFDMLWNSFVLIGVFLVMAAFLHKDLKYVFVLPIAYVSSFISLWLLAGQEIFHIVPYLVGGFELTRGYSEAMAYNGLFWQVLIGLATLFLFLALLVFWLFTRKWLYSQFLVLNLFIIFSLFKSGYVRQDAHVQLFCCYGMLILVFMLGFMTANSAPLRKRAGSWAWISIILVFIALNALSNAAVDNRAPDVFASLSGIPCDETAFRMAGDPALFNTMVADQKRILRENYALNQTFLEEIDGHSIDVIPWEALIPWAYDMKWSPRPVFQSYSAYTPYLDHINSLHYSNAGSAPERVLFSYNSIDHRYPLFDEPETFRTILYNYTSLGRSGEFILLERSSRSSLPPAEDLGTVTVEMGEPVEIPRYEGDVYANVKIPYSSYGAFRKFAYKSSPVSITFYLENSPDPRRYHIIPEIAQDGLWVGSFIGNTQDMEDVFHGVRRHDISRISIDTNNPEQFTGNLTIQFTGIRMS